MTPEQFCYWLRGIFEIQTAGLDKDAKHVPKLTESQIDMIHRHLGSMFEAKIVSPSSALADVDIEKLMSDRTKFC